MVCDCSEPSSWGDFDQRHSRVFAKIRLQATRLAESQEAAALASSAGDRDA